MAQRHMPFGYKIIDGAVVIEPEKADLVRKMFNDFISGISLNRMAKALTEMKVPNANGKPSRNHGSIGKILSNCKYTGSDFYPAIIPEEVFNVANRLREEKNSQLGRNVNYYANSISSTYPFSGRLICGECGSVFKRYTEHHDKNKKCNWKCKRYIVDNRVCCKSGVVDDRQLEMAFMQIINRVMEYPKIIEKRPAARAVTESVELRKIKLQISNGFDQNSLKPSEMAQMLFKRAAEQYRISRVDDFEYKTRKLKTAIESCKPIKAFDEALFKATIKSITVEITGQLRFELINGVVLSTSYTLRRKGGKAHGDGTKNGIGNPCKSDL
ncbi:MAG: recombinase family protein [Firmicutes bacterium]|nr:recombinase family protein [Bacillota bacterium]